MKEINLGEFNFKSIFLVLKKLINRYSLLLVIFLVFIGFFAYASKPFSNQDILYILDNKNNNQMVINKDCIGFAHAGNKKFIYQLSEFLADNKYYQGSAVRQIFFQNLPKNIDDLSDKSSIQVRKQVFIKAILPIIISVNMSIQEDHNKLVDLLNKMPKEDLNRQDIALIKNLSQKYRVDVPSNNFWDYLKVVNLLLTKVNTIPNSLVLAVAIKETGWGKSRFLKEGNSLFSEWTFSDDEGIIPLDRATNKTHKVRSYDNLLRSTESFFNNINISNTYTGFRKTRIKLINSGKPLNSYLLADSLDRYSEEGGRYTESLRSIIKFNNLTAYDKYNSFIESKKPICVYFY